MTVTGIQQRFAPIKRVLPKAVWQPFSAFATAAITPIRFSRKSGHWKSSIAMLAVDACGAPIPWYTYPAIDFLTQRNFAGKNILEFGGGQSTLWWSARAKSVLTIEEDLNWYNRLRTQVGSNVRLHHIPVDHVTRTFEPIGRVLDANDVRAFDIIIIDGHLRRELAALSLSYLAQGGALIMDDAEGYGFYEEIKRKTVKGSISLDLLQVFPCVAAHRLCS